jgi:hypothetical protein
MLKSFAENFKGYCPNCDKPTNANANFCHRCGKCLIDVSNDNQPSKKMSFSELNSCLNETSNIFLLWLASFILVIVSGLISHFLHLNSFIIASTVVFIYLWIFLTSRLDQLAIEVNYQPKSIAYLSILFPVIGTIICFQKIENSARSSIS